MGDGTSYPFSKMPISSSRLRKESSNSLPFVAVTSSVLARMSFGGRLIFSFQSSPRSFIDDSCTTTGWGMAPVLMPICWYDDMGAVGSFGPRDAPLPPPPFPPPLPLASLPPPMLDITFGVLCRYQRYTHNLEP